MPTTLFVLILVVLALRIAVGLSGQIWSVFEAFLLLVLLLLVLHQQLLIIRLVEKRLDRILPCVHIINIAEWLVNSVEVVLLMW